jgi:AbrB family looped-hinge helix DNA binding protein
MARTLVAVNKQGRLTLPVAVRRRLGLGDGSQLEVRVERDVVELRPAAVIRAEDRWAYTREALASLNRAIADIKAGRIYKVSARDLERGSYPTPRRTRARRSRPSV